MAVAHVLLPEFYVAILDELVRLGVHNSRSGAVREGVALLIRTEVPNVYEVAQKFALFKKAAKKVTEEEVTNT